MNAVLNQEQVETKPSQQSCLYITLNNSVHQLFNFQLLNQNADKGFY